MSSVRLWNGQWIGCGVKRKFLFMVLVAYKVNYHHANGRISKLIELRWYPAWRVFESVGEKE